MTVFLNGLPPITHDPTSQEIDFDPPIPVNIGIFLIQTMALVGFVHLYSALNIDHNTSPASGPLWTLYQNRLAICKRAVALVKQVHEAGLPFKTLPTTCGVSHPTLRPLNSCSLGIVLRGHSNRTPLRDIRSGGWPSCLRVAGPAPQSGFPSKLFISILQSLTSRIPLPSVCLVCNCQGFGSAYSEACSPGSSGRVAVGRA